eukprot:UN10240
MIIKSIRKFFRVNFEKKSFDLRMRVTSEYSSLLLASFFKFQCSSLFPFNNPVGVMYGRDFFIGVKLNRKIFRNT